MAVSNEQMTAIINKARVLCNPQSDKMLNNIAKSKGMSSPNDPDPSNFSDDFDSLYLSESYNSNLPNIENYGAASNSNMPSFIKQSLLSNRIDTSGLENMSVLDTIGYKMPKQTPKKVVNENVANVAPQQVVSTPVSNGIDYSVLRAIINECIDSKLKEYFGKKELNESTNLKTISLSGGGIKLVDNSGNVYSAKLEYKGKMKKSDK